MSENLPPTGQPSEPPAEPPASGDWRDERRAWREERRHARYGAFGGAWIGGAILILLGVVFLLQNMGVMFLNNWWALFILIPAAGAFAAAWNSVQANGGRFTRTARSSLFAGLILTMVALVFLFNLNWGLAWPVLLIVIGLAALINALLPA